MNDFKNLPYLDRVKAIQEAIANISTLNLARYMLVTFGDDHMETFVNNVKKAKEVDAL